MWDFCFSVFWAPEFQTFTSTPCIKIVKVLRCHQLRASPFGVEMFPNSCRSHFPTSRGVWRRLDAVCQSGNARWLFLEEPPSRPPLKLFLAGSLPATHTRVWLQPPKIQSTRLSTSGSKTSTSYSDSFVCQKTRVVWTRDDLISFNLLMAT